MNAIQTAHRPLLPATRNKTEPLSLHSELPTKEPWVINALSPRGKLPEKGEKNPPCDLGTPGRPIEYPLGRFQTVNFLLTPLGAAQHQHAALVHRFMNEHHPAKPRMPRIKNFPFLGPVYVTSSTRTIRRARTCPWRQGCADPSRYTGRWSHSRLPSPGWIASPIRADLICDRDRWRIGSLGIYNLTGFMFMVPIDQYILVFLPIQRARLFEVAPLSWTPDFLSFRSPQWQRRTPVMCRSSAGR